MKVIMALSQIICLVLATVVCVSGLSIDESINDAYEASGRHYSFSQRHGSVIAELDMRLRREEWEALYGRHRSKRMTHKSSDKLWSNKTIPYLISNMFGEDQRRMIEESMEVWANDTCLEFRERTRGDMNFVAFTDALYGCSSAVGMEGGRQRIALATDCLKKEVLIHEVGHAIGLYHEHARPDRDDYISINTSNIDADYLNQFNKALWDNIEMHDISYDLRSIMHYGKTYFSINGKPTIIPKDLTFIDIIGNSKSPSFSDFKAVNLMYRCQEHCPTRVCPCDGFMGKDCQCMCPGDPTREPSLIRCVDVTHGPCLLGALQENVKILQDDLMQEKSNVQGLKEDLRKAKNDSEVQQNKVSQLERTQSQFQSQVSQLERTQSEFQNEMNKARSLTAFHVYMEKYGSSFYPNYRDVIPFNRVITNIRRGFSTTTHKFRCPVSGVYAFWFTLYTSSLSDNGKRNTAGFLMMDGTRLSYARCYNGGSDVVEMMCSNQAVTECQAGSHVWVECGTHGVKLWGDSNRLTTFSGFLLREN